MEEIYVKYLIVYLPDMEIRQIYILSISARQCISLDHAHSH